MKKAITIILCVLAAILTALATILILIKSGEKLAYAPLSSFSEISSEALSESPPAPSSSEAAVIEEKPILTLHTPKSKSYTTTDESITFSGNFDENSYVDLNGEQIPTDQLGNFSITKPLEYGQNKFTFSAQDQIITFNINRGYVVISSYSPKTPQTYSAGTTFSVNLIARQGATATAAFNGTAINLISDGNTQDGFVNYYGSFTMPSGHFRDLNLGNVTFTASHSGFTETFNSANIVCKREDIVVDFDPNATPQSGIYTDVGSGIITEIMPYQTETFDINTNKDTSKPTNNYLPKGTLDYGSANTVTIKRDGDSYELITLRCGKTVYRNMRDKPTQNVISVANQYVGTLPDHNEITFNALTNQGSHTILSLDVMWKAPFYFNLMPQAYNSNLTVTDITYSYVDITFCYATVFNGEITIPPDNPLFSHVAIIKNPYDYTLRLYLKKQGGFYGWDSYYDDQGKLCFQFLNPVRINQNPNNAYGADLTGVKILIDVGHGGIDVGAVNGGVYESNCNLQLAFKLKAELDSLGADVYMTRTEDVLSTTDNKLTILKNLKPNFCIAIHHDSNKSKSLNGFGSYYFTPFSKKASELILNHTFNTGIYKDKTFKFHYYYTARSTVCPVVLTESGYMSNSFDFGNIINDGVNTQKAVAITKGIVEYFQSIQ